MVTTVLHLKIQSESKVSAYFLSCLNSDNVCLLLINSVYGSTVCPGNSGLLYIVTNYIRWVGLNDPRMTRSVHPLQHNLFLFSLWVELKHGSRVDKSWALRKKAIKQRSEAYLAFQWSPQTIIQTWIMLIMHSHTLPVEPCIIVS